ncbi:TBKB1 protein, partial [Corvus moneduloides]|nr:TBKB1 protein [Corvus moneduloides]
MDSMFEDDISILTQEALGPDEDWLDSPNTDLSGEMCSASHFALITAYDDIKNRLTGLERENSTLKRRLKMYEVKYPLIGEFGEEHIFSLYEAKETSLLKSEKASLQQQLNQFQHEAGLAPHPLPGHSFSLRALFLSIQLFFVTCFSPPLVFFWCEKRLIGVFHLRVIFWCFCRGARGAGVPPRPDLPLFFLVSFLKFRHFWGLSELEVIPSCSPSREKPEAKYWKKPWKEQGGGLGAPDHLSHFPALRFWGDFVGFSDSCTHGCQCRARPHPWLLQLCSKEGVNLALAYTELTEELCRLRNLSSLQSQILRALLQEKSLNGGQRHSPLSQCHSPAQQRRSPAPQCPSPAPPGRSQCQSPALQRRSPGPPSQSPAQQRRSPAPGPCQSPAQQRRSPVPPPSQSPAQQRRSPAPPPPPCPSPTSASPHRLPGERMELGYAKPSSRHIKAGFQGRRSYSEVTNVALYQQSRSLWLQPEASTLPKHRPYGEVYLGGAGAPLSAHEPFEEHVRFEKQSSDEEEWALPSPPSPEAGAIRCASFCAGFPVPDADAVHRTAAAYARAEHAQSWPSINLLLETVDSEVRSCPLCQLAFPIGYPDDALVKHIDSHLENSKI